MRFSLRVLFLCFGLYAYPAPAVATETLEVHIDADYSIATHSAEAIEQGFGAAFQEAGFEAAGNQLKIVRRDHRANVKRSRMHMERFLQNPNALAMVGGLHSPPYLTHRDFINENGVLFLLPWSAAGPITRGAFEGKNWLFRLSVDDTKAGEFLISRAVDQGDCQAVGLILIDTGWGRSSFKALTAALEARDMSVAESVYFNASIGHATAKTLAEDQRKAKTDCVILLGDWDNGAEIVTALSELKMPPRVFSHWGVMGGPFFDTLPLKTKEKVAIEVLQTCGLSRERNGNSVLKQALSHAEGEPANLSEISASAGFVHGYDFGRILISAIQQAAKTESWGGSIESKRDAVRKVLEDLDAEVPGILRTYVHPFSPYSPSAPDAHEALGADDLCMARFAPEGHLVDAL